MSKVLICVPASGGSSLSPCGSIDGVSYVPSVIDGVVLTPIEYSHFQAVSAPFDLGVASAFFLGFMFLPIVAYCFGVILSFLMRGFRSF